MLAAAWLLAEAGSIVFRGRSFSGWVPLPVEAPLAPAWRGPDDADRIAAAARNPGLFRAHIDPNVGFVLRSDAEMVMQDALVHTDRVGLRVRPGLPARDDAFRILVLGDSVAFGFGVNDDQTLAYQLETLLNDVRPQGARQVVATTVAVPGWNHRNAVHFLLDHAAALPADVVLYMPIGNDLTDTYGVWDSGHRRVAADVAADDPWLEVSLEGPQLFHLGLADRLRERGQAPDRLRLGPAVLNADLSRESARRFDENAASIAALAEHCRRSGARLALLQFSESDYTFHLWTRLADAGLVVPVVPLFDDQLPASFSLPADAHPNPTTLGVMANWVAEALLAAAWVPEARGHFALPPVPPEYAVERAPTRGPDAWRERSEALRQTALAALLPAIDVAEGLGTNQVYGGLNGDGSAQRVLLAVLAAAGPTLQLDLAALDTLAVGPIALRVEVDGTPLTTLDLPAGQALAARLPLPPRADPRAPLEVRLTAGRVVAGLYDGRTQLSAYWPLRLATGD